MIMIMIMITIVIIILIIMIIITIIVNMQYFRNDYNNGHLCARPRTLVSFEL